MEKLIVLGNGFDLSCSLKTRFSDFYKTKEKKYFTPLSYLPSCNFIFFLIYETFQTKNEKVKNAFQQALGVNESEDWLNLELLLKNFITGECFNTANNAFHRYRCSNYTDLIYSEFDAYFKKRTITNQQAMNFEFFLNSELHDFEECLSKYIKDEQNTNKSYINNANIQLRKLIDNSYNFGIISFNYTTPSLDLFPEFYIHVHGSINDEIIIGIDKKEIDVNGPTLNRFNEISDKSIFTKTRRLLSYFAMGKIGMNVLEKGVKIITFYGHSLGEQDYSYFQSIFDFYHIYDSNVILEFCFSEYCEEFGNEFEADRTSTRVFKLIEKYGETFDNKDHGKNLIHKMLLENRLRIRRID